MSSKPDTEQVDEENPEWTEEMFLRARPAHEVLAEIFDPILVENLLRSSVESRR